MFERFTPDARTVVVHAQEHARRLGHRHIGCEHLLLAVAGTADPAGATLRELGITAEDVEEEVVRRVGLGGGAALFGGLDRDALAAVGVDLDAVRARIVASFDADALACAAGRREPHRNRRRLHRVIPSVLFRRKRRRALVASAIGPAATGRFRAEGAPSRAHLPFTTAAREVLADGVREAQSLRDGYIGVEHLALGLIRTDGLVKPILHALGTSAPAVRAELLDRYRKAG